MKKLLLVLTLFTIGFVQEIPKPVGHVNDFAGILPKDMSNRLEAKLRTYKTETSNEVSVVTVKTLGGMSVEDYTIRLAKAWGVGNKKKDNGVVFLIAPNDRRCRIEVGYGLEPKLTDIQAKRIIESVVIPKFKQGQMPSGIEAGAESILLSLTGKLAPAAPAAPSENDPGGGVVLIIFGVVIGVVILIAVMVSFSGSRISHDWSSSSSDLSPIVTGVALGSLLSSTRPEKNRSSYSSDDDSDSDSGGSFGGFGGGSFGGGGASGSW